MGSLFTLPAIVYEPLAAAKIRLPPLKEPPEPSG